MKTVFVTLLMIGVAMGQQMPKEDLTCRNSTCLCDTDEISCRPALKPAKPPAKKAEPIIELMGATKCKIVPAGDGCNACTVCDGPNSASMCTTMYCTQKGEIEKLLKSPPEPPPNAPPLDVPAIRKTRVIHPKGTCWGEGQNAVCAMQKDDTEDYWDCEDRDAYSLQISVSGKRANCHRIVP